MTGQEYAVDTVSKDGEIKVNIKGGLAKSSADVLRFYVEVDSNVFLCRDIERPTGHMLNQDVFTASSAVLFPSLQRLPLLSSPLPLFH